MNGEPLPFKNEAAWMMNGPQLPWPELMLEVRPEPKAKSLRDKAVPETTSEEMLDVSKPAHVTMAASAVSWAAESDCQDSMPVQPHLSSEARLLLHNRPWTPKAFWSASPAFASAIAAPLPPPLVVPPPLLAAERGVEGDSCKNQVMSMECYDGDAESWLTDSFLHDAEKDDGGELQHNVHVTVEGSPVPILIKSKEARFARRAKTHRLGQRVCFPDPAMTQTTHDVTPYSEVYGVHPRRFQFDAEGNKMLSIYHPSAAKTGGQ